MPEYLGAKAYPSNTVGWLPVVEARNVDFRGLTRNINKKAVFHGPGLIMCYE